MVVIIIIRIVPIIIVRFVLGSWVGRSLNV